MDAKEKVLATMKEAGQPLNAGKIAELSGLDRKEVDVAMKQLKAEGAIVSPVRCKWAPADLVYQAEIAANTKLSASELTEIKTTLKRIENKDSSLLSQGIA